MTNPAATGAFASGGAQLQGAFGGGKPSPAEAQIYQNPAGWTLAPFIGMVDASRNASAPPSPTPQSYASPGVRSSAVGGLNPGRNPTNSGTKTLLGQ